MAYWQVLRMVTISELGTLREAMQTWYLCLMLSFAIFFIKYLSRPKLVACSHHSQDGAANTR